MKLSNLELEDIRCRQSLARLGLDDPEEDWRYVVTPGLASREYMVSEQGRVLSLPRYREYDVGGLRHRKFLPGRLLKPGKKPSGHYNVTLIHQKTAYQTHVHQLVVWAFLGVHSETAIIRHIDGNTENNRLDNLKYDAPLAFENRTSLRSLRARIEAALHGDEDPITVLKTILAAIQ